MIVPVVHCFPKMDTITTLATENESSRKKKLLEQLMDDEIIKTTKNKVAIDIEFEVDKEKEHTNPLMFWKEYECFSKSI